MVGTLYRNVTWERVWLLEFGKFERDGKFERGGNNLAGNFQREYDGGNKLAVSFPGVKFSRRYIFFGGEGEPTLVDKLRST